MVTGSMKARPTGWRRISNIPTCWNVGTDPFHGRPLCIIHPKRAIKAVAFPIHLYNSE